jgi:hypothetical protein
MTCETVTGASDANQVPVVSREQAEQQIELCEPEMKDAETRGMNMADAHRSLKIARSFLKLGMYEKAFLFAVRARRIAMEKKAQRA